MKHTKLLIRDNGTKIKIVAEYFPDFRVIGKYNIDHYVLILYPNKTKWQLITHATLDKSLHNLSVEEYKQFGRTGLLSVVTYSEIIKTTLELKEKLMKIN